MKTVRLFLAFVFAFALLGYRSQVTFAQDSACDPGSLSCLTTEDNGAVEPQADAGFKNILSMKLKGGYVAHGVGMRNTGYGSITVNDIPAGAKVVKAYLYWAVIGPKFLPGFYYYKGKFNGKPVTGVLLGSTGQPGWSVTSQTWGYRADVTGKMFKGGNGVYNLTGFASGATDGSDPFTSGVVLPLMEGASLVVVYSHPSAPTTLIKVSNGPRYVGLHELHLNVTGMNATGLTGIAKTTFIGADGQSNLDEYGSSFFTNLLGSVGWDGGDPNGAGYNYLYGNLWDTQTVDLSYLLDPPETDFWFSTGVGGGLDALVWVAQVTSYSSGNQDSDGDRILDGYELHGYGYLNLPAWGADPLHKDLFVEADYMRPDANHDHLPDLAHLNDIVNVFNNAPVSNPDGTTGIHLHIDTGGAAFGAAPGTYAAYNLGGGNQVTEANNLGTSDASCNAYNWDDFQTIKNSNFDVTRSGIFHYMIFAHNLAPCFGTVSGISRNGNTDAQFIKGAADFIVSLGGWPGMGTQDQREGTFIHEFGHNLGLRHGGNDHRNYKPNYLSVMNYSFQMSGVTRDSRSGNYDYSRFLLPSLNENSLVEANGLGPLAAGYGTRYYSCTNAGTPANPADSNIDWNCNGVVSGTVAADINKDGVRTTLGTQNNWASITFLGGGVIGTGASLGDKIPALAITTRTDELDYETWLQHEDQ